MAKKKTYKIGLIDADLLDGGTRHPNLALLKISGFCKSRGYKVRLICNYDEIRDNLKRNDKYDNLTFLFITTLISCASATFSTNA